MWCSSRGAGDATRGIRINSSGGFLSILKISKHTEPGKNGVLEISRKKRERSWRGLIRSKGKAGEQGFWLYRSRDCSPGIKTFLLCACWAS
jgi:hypothetical protein